MHYFISQHIPLQERRPNKPPKMADTDPDGKPRSCLKQKMYDTNITDSKSKIDFNYFSLARAPRRQKQRDNHIKSILNQYNTKLSPEKPGDVEMANEEKEMESTNGSPTKTPSPGESSGF